MSIPTDTVGACALATAIDSMRTLGIDPHKAFNFCCLNETITKENTKP